MGTGTAWPTQVAEEVSSAFASAVIEVAPSAAVVPAWLSLHGATRVLASGDEGIDFDALAALPRIQDRVPLQATPAGLFGF
jgi:hypothetical protein